ncbi:MAG: nitroreductase family protein [Anaerolineae bacterium]|jgi:nitroreductase
MSVIDPQALLWLMQSRRSIRRYQDRPVPDELIEQMLEAARLAPSAANSQPWRFVVVRDPELRRRVAQHAASYFIRWAHVDEAPLLIVLCGQAGRTYLHTDVALAGMQLMLQAHVLGLGTCWVGALQRKPLTQLLRVPKEIEIVGLLTVGFPAEQPKPTPRKPLADLIHYDVYGNQEPGDNAEPGLVRSGPLSVLLRWFRLPFRL